MKEIEFGSQSILVDENRTRDLYNLLTNRLPPIDWCQCDACTNARITRRRFMPSTQVQLLRSLVLNPFAPLYSSGVRRYESESRDFAWWRMMWFVYATMDNSKPSPRSVFENKSVVWINDIELPQEAYSRINNYRILDPEGLVFVRASNAFPWL